MNSLRFRRKIQLFINLIQYTGLSGCRTCGQLSWLQAASPCLRIISLQGGQLDGAMTAKALSLERWGGGGYDGKKKANLASRTRATKAGIMSFDMCISSRIPLLSKHPDFREVITRITEVIEY